jgi:glucose/arabinose dehydrogenase
MMLRTVSCSLLFLLLQSQGYAYESAGQSFKIDVLTEQKDCIWGFDFLPSGNIVFTQRDGELKQLNVNTHDVITIKNIPEVAATGQGGLLDVRVHPKFNSTHWLYLTYSVALPSGMTTRLARAELADGALTHLEVLFTAFEANDNRIHFGGRIEFDGQGHLFLSMGERNERDKAQSLSFDNGKILRLNDDGSIPSDNPFVDTAGARPEIWSLGHRNPQGLVIHPQTGELWEAEFGPLGGDEINLIKPSQNYGWPVITYGREYYGMSIGDGTSKAGMQQPIAYYVPSISPSGIGFYDGEAFPQWKGNLFVAALSGQQLQRLVIENHRVVNQEALLTDLKWRFRHVRQGIDGLLYMSTDAGKIARISP